MNETARINILHRWCDHCPAGSSRLPRCKTGVITQKIAWLIREKQYAPESIVAVTFTNKAAAEMRERVTKIMKERGVATGAASGTRNPTKGLTVSTFHRLGMGILNRDGETIGIRRGFTILDQSDSLTALREIIRESKAAID